MVEIPSDPDFPDESMSLASVTSSLHPFQEARICQEAPSAEVEHQDVSGDLTIGARVAADRERRRQKVSSNIPAYHVQSCVNAVTAVMMTQGEDRIPLDSTAPTKDFDLNDFYCAPFSHTTPSGWKINVVQDLMRDGLPDAYADEAARINALMADPSLLDKDTWTHGEALKSPDYLSFWHPVLLAEMNNLNSHGVGREIRRQDIPKGALIYRTKFHLKKKRNTVGEFTKGKARLVVLFNLIKTGVASFFAPTVNERSVKLLLILSMIFGLRLNGVDITGAFLYPELPEDQEIYIELPRKFTGEPVYWKLIKTLYGLGDSPRYWYEDMCALLLSHNYVRTMADPCMFIKTVGDAYIIIAVHVDDFLSADNSDALLDELLTIMRSRYDLTVSDSVEDYIGLHIAHLPDGSILLTQPHKITQLATDFDLLTATPPSVPMSSLFNDEYQDGDEKCDFLKYMHVLGRLMYIIKTRPEISYAVSRLASRSHCCTNRDFKALLRVVSYLFGTIEIGLFFKKISITDRVAASRLFCFVDAAYATYVDGKSHTGYCFSLGGILAMFFSRSCKQSNVTLSSTEAENAAAVEATKDILWFRLLLQEIGFPQLTPTVVYADNASMIVLANDFSGSFKRVKHYAVRINFMIEQVRLHIIELVHVEGDLNTADILTKPLGPTLFEFHRPRLLGYI